MIDEQTADQVALLQAIKLGVDLRLAERPQRRGSILGLSPEGALLGYRGVPPGLAPGQTLQLGLRLPPGNAGSNYRIDARVVNRDEQGIAVRFIGAGAKFTTAVQAYLKKLADAAAETERQRRDLDTRREPLRASLRKIAINDARLPERAERLIECWIRLLHSQAQTAANDADRTRCEDDAAILEQARNQDGLGFSLTAQWLRPLQPGPSATHDHPATAAVLDDASSDRWLTRQRLVDALEHNLRQPLATYHAQIGVLGDASSPLPFTPASMVEALEQLLDALPLADASRLQLLRESLDPLTDLFRPLLETLTRSASV